MKKVLLSTAYLPPIFWFQNLITEENVVIEQHEYFIKQTYRNRCEILSANGKLSLSIPLVHQSNKEIINQKRISYAENWQQNHWRAITSAYKNSPYFEFFEDELRGFYERRYDLLIEYNTDIIKTLLKLLRLKKQLIFSGHYSVEFEGQDLRNSFSPKVSNSHISKHYHQVFSDKFDFVPDLSVIDLIFNQGLNSIDYLSLKL